MLNLNDGQPPRKQFEDFLTEKLADLLLGEKLPLDIYRSDTSATLHPAGKKFHRNHCRLLARNANFVECDPSPVRNKIRQVIAEARETFAKAMALK